jgi:hypothetical protein
MKEAIIELYIPMWLSVAKMPQPLKLYLSIFSNINGSVKELQPGWLAM